MPAIMFIIENICVYIVCKFWAQVQPVLIKGTIFSP